MADLLTFLNNRGRYTPLALTTAATLSGPKGLPGFRGNGGDKFEFESYGTIEVEGVPFELQDPQDGRLQTLSLCKLHAGRTLPRCHPNRHLRVLARSRPFTCWQLWPRLDHQEPRTTTRA